MKRSLHHISVTTSDPKSCRAFWETVFGAQEIESAGPKRPETSWYQMGEIELHLQYREKPINKTDQHFAVVVDDLDEVVGRAERMGRRVELAEPLPGFSKRYYVYDPDDNRIEALQC